MVLCHAVGWDIVPPLLGTLLDDIFANGLHFSGQVPSVEQRIHSDGGDVSREEEYGT